MKTATLIVALLAPLAVSAWKAECDAFKLPAGYGANVTLIGTDWYDAGANVTLPAGSSPAFVTGLPAFCRVNIIINTNATAGTRARSEIWLPDSWNSRVVSLGNGGWAGSISYSALANSGVRLGFAAVSTNTGHNASEFSPQIPAGFAYRNRESLVDFAWRALHLSTVALKDFSAAYYGKSASKSYYVGCSTGGRQGLTAAQYFPADYDGMTIGAPANRFWALQAWSIYVGSVVRPVNSSTWIDQNLWRTVIAPEVLKQCDDLDGAKDGIISDPSKCNVQFDTITCRPGQSASTCLTLTQIDAARALYDNFYDASRARADGARLIRRARQNSTYLYGGFNPGFELQSSGLIGPMLFATSSSYFNVIIRGLNQTEFDFEGLTLDDISKANMSAYTTAELNAQQPNMTAYFNRGGKILQYVGLSDGLISPRNSMYWYDLVKDWTVANTQTNLTDSYLLYTVPGMGHCQGGYAAESFGARGEPTVPFEPAVNVVAATQAWVEQGTTPGEIVARAYINATVPTQGVAFTRPLCKWPASSHYKGSGDVAEASSWYCE